MGRYITDVNILAPYEGQPVQVPTGWHKLDTDLNSGTKGGDRLYLVYERCDQDLPITDIRILVGDQTPDKGYQKIPVDLNKGAVNPDDKKPHPLFLAVSREADDDRKSIEALVINSWADGEKKVDPPSGYRRIGTDLNKGVGGAYVYLDYQSAVTS
ncbi:hypothetical protein [Kitasatospora sp. NPDC057738]|uniref:hypothetical protein n=1 Tax=Kitasatospora sp. NPDC057738 TaxID=3346233 RepID=UPI0036A6C1F6